MAITLCPWDFNSDWRSVYTQPPFLAFRKRVVDAHRWQNQGGTLECDIGENGESDLHRDRDQGPSSGIEHSALDWADSHASRTLARLCIREEARAIPDF